MRIMCVYMVKLGNINGICQNISAIEYRCRINKKKKKMTINIT